MATPSPIPENNCVFAVPKKGRLYEPTMKLLEGAGIQYSRVTRGGRDGGGD